MSYASYEEMEDAVSEEYREKISELEDQVVELAKEIDALKHEVDVEEAQAERFKKAWKEGYHQLETLRNWIHYHHPEILTTYEVTQRLEEGK